MKWDEVKRNSPASLVVSISFTLRKNVLISELSGSDRIACLRCLLQFSISPIKYKHRARTPRSSMSPSAAVCIMALVAFSESSRRPSSTKMFTRIRLMSRNPEPSSRIKSSTIANVLWGVRIKGKWTDRWTAPGIFLFGIKLLSAHESCLSMS